MISKRVIVASMDTWHQTIDARMCPLDAIPKFIEVNFLYFSIDDCGYGDSLKIYKGPSDASPVIEEFCGKKLPASFISPSNEILLVFKSDDDEIINSKGFMLEYNTSSK